MFIFDDIEQFLLSAYVCKQIHWHSQYVRNM